MLWTDGAYHPDSATIDVAMSTEMMTAGQIGMATNGFAAVFGNSGFRTTIKETVPDADLQPLIMPGADGGQGVTYQGTGIFGYTAMPGAIEGDDERIDTLLKVVNYLHAPFGSEESTFLRYGIEGVHSDRSDDGGFVLTDLGTTEQGALVYPFLSENYFYYPGAPDEAVAAQKHNEAMAQVAVSNPCALLFSPSQGEFGATLAQLLTDMYTEVVTGRSGIEKLEEVRAEWRERGGDQIRAEYEEMLAAQG
jgi:putative aldouronate transport system substrate-binding protein